jgi:hypothetical protein
MDDFPTLEEPTRTTLKLVFVDAELIRITPLGDWTPGDFERGCDWGKAPSRGLL